MDRKHFLTQFGGGLAMSAIPSMGWSQDDAVAVDPADFATEGDPGDEKFWKQIARKYYDISPDYINLENGYYGIQSKPVLQAYLKNIAYVNRESIRFARRVYPDTLNSVRETLAGFLGVSGEEIIITRNATEALNIAIQGYPFRPGDEVLLHQLDYFSMIETFEMLEKRGQIRVKHFDMPLWPEDEEEIVEIYRSAMTDKTRVILLTHVSNINGLIVPVAKITAMARDRGVDVITDSAHALGQLDYSLTALGCDFVGMNLHKWIGNPIGAGVLYVRKERIPELRAMYGDVSAAEDHITKLAHFGTTPFPVIMTIPDSINFHNLIGVSRKQARLQFLKETWVHEVKDIPGVEVVTPTSKNLSCAIASFRIKNKKTRDLGLFLLEKYGILTTGRVLGEEGCIRVTPSIFNAADDLHKLAAAIKEFANG